MQRFSERFGGVRRRFARGFVDGRFIELQVEGRRFSTCWSFGYEPNKYDGKANCHEVIVAMLRGSVLPLTEGKVPLAESRFSDGQVYGEQKSSDQRIARSRTIIEIKMKSEYKRYFTTLTFLFAGFLPGMLAAAKPTLVEEPYLFAARSGEEVDAFKGTFHVPENRANPRSREIAISYVRFPSTGEYPGPPIIYLAGGPGGSGVETARAWRFSLFMAMRDFGDVIALDQRGTGWSNHIPVCEANVGLPLDQAILREDMEEGMAELANGCAAFWEDAGVDLAGYNTLESARDIEALRTELGVEKVSLWGISYGSHLALATLKTMPRNIHKVVIASVEGLDQTVKLPARTDAYFERLQAAINADAEAAKLFPDIKDLMRRVHSRLEATPAAWEITSPNSEAASVAIGKVEMQILASSMISDPRLSKELPWLYLMAESGDFSEVGPIVYRYIKAEPVLMRGMPEAMDVMSGIPPKRLELVSEQAEGALLGDMLNFPMPHMRGVFRFGAFGEDFWEPVVSDVPTLAFSGTLDGRTYPESAREALAGFSRLSHVVVRNGGHNLYMQGPQIAEAITSFMIGEAVPDEIELEAPKFRVR